MTSAPADTLDVAPGSVVVVRDEEWLVTGVEDSADGWLLHVQGLTELVRDTTATFYSGLDDIEPLDPTQAAVVADDSPHYRRARLWLEATLRKTAVPPDDRLTVSARMLADSLEYQHEAVRKALSPDNLRPRILLADAVGLGKTLEIGMILAELVRRGRGERILIVSPRHVLEQMQHEMWTRFALPFVRLDSVGIQRVRQKLPASRNPFTYFKRVIISIDTLKSERYRSALRHHRWDAVVIDESHNLTNTATQNNQLARVLAPNTDALILASATPHNGRKESFAELIRLLEPTAVSPTGDVHPDDLARLIVRRHRHSPEVARVVGNQWAERKEPQNWLVPASPAENAVAAELDEVWLHPATGTSPYSGHTKLFGWTLAKAFLSSPAALLETVRQRIGRLGSTPDPAQRREIEALRRLEDLTVEAEGGHSAKYDRLLRYLRELGVGPHSDVRVVVFAERIATLRWLRDRLTADLKFKPDAVEIMHGGLPDEVQQDVVESFKQTSSPIRILVTGDVASEGVNLHSQCHELVHFDIPWSLIRIEQRNGRIDRYGQRHAPQITTLLLDLDTDEFAGDLRVLSRLIERETEAHQALGDVASLMGKHSVSQEEDEIRRVLAGERRFDDVVRSVDAVASLDGPDGLLAQLMALEGTHNTPATPDAAPSLALFDDTLGFLTEALTEAFGTPAASLARGGLEWRRHDAYDIVELTPPPDLRQRLEVLPQSYLTERRVTERLQLVTTIARGKELLASALTDESDSTWPEAHYLGPLHPVIDWAADRALSRLPRNHVFAVRGDVEHPTVVVLGILTNRRGQVVTTSCQTVEFPNPANPTFAPVTPYDTAADLTAALGLTGRPTNPGPVADAARLQPLVGHAVRAAAQEMARVFDAAEVAAADLVERWSERADAWQESVHGQTQFPELRRRAASVATERELAEQLAPDRQLVRPLLVVLPQDHPVGEPDEGDQTPARRPADE